MITRDVSQLQVVPAFVHAAKFHSCTIAGYTCTEGSGETSAIGDSGFMPGYVIDRRGLQRSYNSMMIAPVAYGQIGACGTATKVVTWMGLSLGLQHTSATGGTWANYSTGDWIVKQGLWRQTTATSTGELYYSVVQADAGLTSEIGLGGVMTSATSTAAGSSITAGATSTEYAYYAGPGPVFDLSGAKRYLRPLVRVHMVTTGDTGGVFSDMNVSAAAVFGEPDLAQPPQNPVKRILVTSGCAT